MIRRILHFHYFFVPFFSFFLFFFFLFFLFVRSALNFAPLSTTYRKSIAGSRLLSDKEVFCCHFQQHDLYINFFQRIPKNWSVSCFLHIIDRANFKKKLFPNDTCFHNKIDRKKKFPRNYLSNSMYHTLSTVEIKYFSSVSLVLSLSLSGLVLISKLLTSVDSFGPKPDKRVVVALNLCWWRASDEPTRLHSLILRGKTKRAEACQMPGHQGPKARLLSLC